MIAAVTFVLGIVLDHTKSPLNAALVGAIVFCSAVAFALLVASIYCSLNAIANVFRTSRGMIRSDVPSRYFFNQRETLEKFHSFDDFSKNFKEMDSGNFLESGIAELWAISTTQNARYSKLRWAVRFFLAAMLPFIIAVGLLMTAAL
jgi:hypothetical protein